MLFKYLHRLNKWLYNSKLKIEIIYSAFLFGKLFFYSLLTTNNYPWYYQRLGGKKNNKNIEPSETARGLSF